MKVGVVGSGLVGSTVAYAMVMRGVGREVVLVDIDLDRARAEAADIMHAVPFASPIQISAGGYEKLKGARVVVITAGTARRPGESRLELMGRNAGIFKKVVPAILEHAPDCVFVVVTNPVDVMTHLTARYAGELGVPATRVVGSGTTLDTARFRALLGEFLGVDSHHVHGYVIGEHGDSEVLTWSQVRAGIVPLNEFCIQRGLCVDSKVRADMDERVRRAGADIIKGKGATHYGIGSAVANIVQVILYDQRAILTVGSHIDEIEGVEDVTISMPCLVGGEGIMTRLDIPLFEEEHRKLHASALVVRDAIAQLDGEG
jgi:L-lactate dehydrogenase